MTKPILRVGKIKKSGSATLQSVSGHLARTSPTANADPKRTSLNQWLAGGPDLKQRFEALIANKGIDADRLRRDAVLANDVLLTVSPSWFRSNPDDYGKYEPEKVEVFKTAALGFLREQFGERLIGAVLHLDEATPHIQAVTVPIVQKPDRTWKLSAKETFTPTRLVDLQEQWQDRMARHGVGPRLAGSRATHTAMKKYYGSIDTTPAIPNLAPSPPPSKPFFETSVTEQNRLNQWQQDEAKKARKKLKPLAAAAAKGALYEAERASSASLREQLHGASKLRAEIEKLNTQLDLAKEQIASLRTTNINQVALALGYTGEIGKRENAIDLVRRVGGVDFSDAVAWLHHSFGPNAAPAALREQNITNPPRPILTGPEKVKARAIDQQLSAIRAEKYRITVMRRDGEGKKIGQNLGKRENEPEVFFKKEDILKMIPTLTAFNAGDGNVFITPVDDSTHFVLIDDLKHEDMNLFRERGYDPALVLETSPGNHQAIVKIGKDCDDYATNEWFKSINRELGDEKITGLIHPMRLAGFQNRKEKYEDNGRFPFVKVIEASGRFCARAREVILRLAVEITNLAPR